MDVPPLGLPDPLATGSVARLAGVDAVRLFVERATSASPTFRLGRQSLASVARVCRRLDGIPLPIELAAAWVRVLPVEEIAARLQERLELLKNRDTGAPPRHQTLRATLEWSYSLLGEGEQRLLRHLSVFVGGWSLEAAEAVCGDESAPPEGVLLGMAALVDASLVVYEEQREGGRYRLLETTRQYARERLALSPEEQRAAAQRHADYFLHSALAMQEEIKATFNQHISELVSEQVRADRENYLTAWRWWQQEDAETGVKMMLALYHMRVVWMPIVGVECRTWIERLATSERPAPSPLQADLYLVVYEWARWAADPRWRSLLETALALAEGCQDLFAQAVALYGLGYHEAFKEENYALGQSYLERARDCFHRGGYTLRAAMVQHYLAQLARLRGEPSGARRLAEGVLRIGRETGSVEVTCIALRTLGEIAFREEDYARARLFYEDVLLCCSREDDAYAISALRMLGRIAARQGDFAASKNYLLKSIALCQERGEWPNVAWGYEALSHAARQEGDYAAAVEHLTHAIRLVHAPDAGREWDVVFFLGDFAHLAREQGQTERAATLWGFREAMMRQNHWKDSPDDSRPYQEALAALKAATPAETFAAAWSRGAAMSLSEAVRYALMPSIAPS
jgi:predicted ATPase